MRRPWPKTLRLLSLWIERATCCGYRPGPLKSLIAGLEPSVPRNPELAYEILETGHAYHSLNQWKQRVLWLRFTESQQWNVLRRQHLRISKTKFDGIVLEVQDALMARDPDIFWEEIVAEMAERNT